MSENFMNKLLALVPWGLSKLVLFSSYAMGIYILAGVLFTLLIEVSVNSLNILFGLGIVLSGVLVVPAIMSADSGSSALSKLFIGTVFSYPLVYLLSLIASRWISVIASNHELALMIAALPLINVMIIFGVVATIMLRPKPG